MADIIIFSEHVYSCRRCQHCLPIGNRDYMCNELNFVLDDGSIESIYPIINGKRSDDWNACSGEHYEHNGKLKRR